jgi:hypothetical protein
VIRLGGTWGLVLTSVGCGSNPPPPAGTGAAEAAERFFAALVARDWSIAYDGLDDATKAKWALDCFRTLATNFRTDWGFDPESVLVRSCDEHGNDATAHVVLSGRGKTGHKLWKDAVVLRRGPAGWRVIPPSTFGKPPAGH